MGFCETTIFASTVPARTKLAQSQEFLVYRPIYQVISPPRGARASQFLHLAVVCRQSKGSGGSTINTTQYGLRTLEKRCKDGPY